VRRCEDDCGGQERPCHNQAGEHRLHKQKICEYDAKLTVLLCFGLQTLGGEKFDAVFDMNARELGDTQPLADLFLGKVDHYVFMSSAGVYLKSDVMPHLEEDAVDQKSRHKGKLDSEEYLAKVHNFCT
jgi:hypothetical protein